MNTIHRYPTKGASRMPVTVVLLTDESDPSSVLPSLGMVAQKIRYAPLTSRTTRKYRSVDAAIVDGRTDASSSRRTCQKVAASSPETAVVLLIAPQDLVTVDLDWHVDDLVLPTAGTDELQTRLRLAIERRRNAMARTLRFGDLVLHPATYVASLPDRDLELTLTEFKLLNFLVQNSDRAFTRTRLMHEVWGHERGRRTVDVHVQRLRVKLGTEYESMVDTVRGVGYKAIIPRPRGGAKPPSATIAAGQ